MHFDLCFRGLNILAETESHSEGMNHGHFVRKSYHYCSSIKHSTSMQCINKQMLLYWQNLLLAFIKLAINFHFYCPINLIYIVIFLK